MTFKRSNDQGLAEVGKPRKLRHEAYDKLIKNEEQLDGCVIPVQKDTAGLAIAEISARDIFPEEATDQSMVIRSGKASIEIPVSVGCFTLTRLVKAVIHAVLDLN